MKIIANTASLFSPRDGKQMGLTILPEYVQIRGRSYRDYLDISTEDFIEQLRGGNVPTTSQPALGELLSELENKDDEAIILTLPDGISGEYMTASAAARMLHEEDHIHVVDSGTLGGPLRYLVRKAALLREQGMSTHEILRQLRESINSSVSYVVPADFSYLKRSGRISHLTAKLGGSLRLLPVLTQSEDRRSISFVCIKRSLHSAVDLICTRMADRQVGRQHLITVSHAGAPEMAERVRNWLYGYFPDTETEIFELPPSLITHGGPGCILVQAIRK